MVAASSDIDEAFGFKSKKNVTGFLSLHEAINRESTIGLLHTITVDHGRVLPPFLWVYYIVDDPKKIH